MNEVSLVRLYLLRAMYFLIVAGFCVYMWPAILRHEGPWTLLGGVVNCMLVAFWTLCLFGLRYPLQMLPMLLWEFIWKALWLLVVALPQWRSGQMDANTQANAFACVFAVLIPFVLPWGYLVRHYFRKPGDPWARGAQRFEARPGASMR